MSSSTKKPLNLQQLLGQDDYKIPVYQRNYDWGESQIQQLIDDIQDYAEKNDKSTSYYIGSLVVHQKTDYFEILDGQQRYTTLSLLAYYLKYRLSKSFDLNGVNLSFESRSKSEFTINKLFEVFCSNETSKYDSPGKLSELVGTVRTDKTNASILEGFKVIDRVITSNFAEKGDDSLNKFANYLMEKVKILRVCVPQNTDVTHYFEVMNNRGEQLEKHEVVKAHLLSVVQKDTQATAVIQKIWLACSDMSRYVQLGFSVDERNAIFDEYSKGFLINGFDDLVKNFTVQSETLVLGNSSLSLESALEAGKKLRKQESDKNTDNDNKDEGKVERFTSVIDFPNFLMQVLRIYTMSQFNKDLPALDDKDLIEAFQKFVGEDTKKVKGFISLLLKLRYLFDRYVVKRERLSGEEDWSLKRYKFDSNSSSYVNSFGVNEGDKSGKNLSCMMLQSAFHVSYPTNSRKNWLSAVLCWLNDKEKSNSITAEEYLNFLESLARAFMVNRYLTTTRKKFKDFMYIIDNSAKFTVSSDVLNECLRYGRVRVFAFNYLDYLLWKDTELLQETKSKFRFSFKSSVEHFSPQTSRINEILPENKLHGFGNLCLMGSSENSSLSNDTPKQKTEILNSQRNRMAPLSLKLELMMQTAQENWNIKTIDSHRYDMVKILQEDIEQKLKSIG